MGEKTNKNLERAQKILDHLDDYSNRSYKRKISEVIDTCFEFRPVRTGRINIFVKRDSILRPGGDISIRYDEGSGKYILLYRNQGTSKEEVNQNIDPLIEYLVIDGVMKTIPAAAIPYNRVEVRKKIGDNLDVFLDILVAKIKNRGRGGDAITECIYEFYSKLGLSNFISPASVMDDLEIVNLVKKELPHEGEYIREFRRRRIISSNESSGSVSIDIYDLNLSVCKYFSEKSGFDLKMHVKGTGELRVDLIIAKGEKKGISIKRKRNSQGNSSITIRCGYENKEDLISAINKAVNKILEELVYSNFPVVKDPESYSYYLGFTKMVDSAVETYPVSGDEAMKMVSSILSISREIMSDFIKGKNSLDGSKKIYLEKIIEPLKKLLALSNY